MIHKTTRSILSVLLAALLLIASTPLTPAFAGGGGVLSQQSVNNEGQFAGGSGTVDDPYQISSADDLQKFAEKVNSGETTANARLTADIDLSGVKSWSPIGDSSGNPYSGIFDGDGHTISGLNIASGVNDQGLFRYVGSRGTVKNLTVDGTVSGAGTVGGIVARNSGTIQNCAFRGSVSGSSFVGGIVGQNNSGGTVTNCTNTGSVSGGSSVGSSVGGVVGYNGGDDMGSVGGSVTNCYNTGKVSDDSFVGGVVGGVVGHNIGPVKNCYNTGEVSGSGSGNGINVGGVVGNNSGTVTGCYNSGTVTGPDSVSGSYVGGVVGANGSGTVTGCYFLQTGELSGIGLGGSEEGAAGLTAEDFKDETKFSTSSWDFDDTWSISGIHNRPVLQSNPQGGLGTDKSPYQISNATELKNFATAVNTGSTTAHAVLMNNIDLSSVCGPTLDSEQPVSWTPIGNSEQNAYTGTFNGNGKTISGLYINSSSDNYQGLFGCLSGGTVKNLTVDGNVTGNGGRVGGVVGYNNGPVKNCYNTGTVSGPDSGSANVGGVVGRNYNASVENCYNIGKVTSSADSSNVGGVVGYNYGGSVENCYNTGSVSGPDSVNGETTVNVGGVVGYNISSSVTNCYNTGTVTGLDSGTGNRVGGVVGYNDGSFTNCYFLQGTAGSGIGKNEGSDTATEKDDTAFHSGEVAYLLQSKQTAVGEGEPALVWGQTLSGEEKSLPTLNPTAEQKVYRVTFDYGDSFAEADDRYDYHYGNANDTVTLPTSTDQIPEYEGHTLTGWLDANNQQVSGQTVTITADTKFTAQWQQNLSVTAPTFAEVTEDYTQPAAKPLTITNIGDTAETISGVALSGTNANAFSLNNTGSTTIAAGVTDSSTYTIQPAANLAAGTYTATITVTYDNGVTATAEVSFTVNEKPTPEPDPDPTPTPTPDPEPSGPSTGDSTGWADILDELENAENGDQITIDMGEETEVPAEIFESLAGKEVEVIFDLGDVQWSASGETIPTDTDFTDINLGVDLGTSGIPVNVINAITGEVGTVQITLAHNGEFGFTLTLTAPLGKENAGYWANLYHFDESAEALNFEAAAKIDQTGSVTIPFSHASQYAIVIDTHSHARVAVSDIFTDVAPDAWYTAAIQYAYDNRLMTGVSDTEFAPEATTTRAMIVSILARLENVTTAQAAGFADVEDNDWYATAVNWAASENIVAGFEDGTFRPNAAITREQLAAILMNYAAYKGEDVSARADLSAYTDQPSTWATETMQWAVAEGLITGVTNTELQPQSSATRAQVAAILQRFLEA